MKNESKKEKSLNPTKKIVTNFGGEENKINIISNAEIDGEFLPKEDKIKISDIFHHSEINSTGELQYDNNENDLKDFYEINKFNIDAFLINSEIDPSKMESPYSIFPNISNNFNYKKTLISKTTQGSPEKSLSKIILFEEETSKTLYVLKRYYCYFCDLKGGNLNPQSFENFVRKKYNEYCMMRIYNTCPFSVVAYGFNIIINYLGKNLITELLMDYGGEQVSTLFPIKESKIILELFKQLIKGLDYLQTCNIAHNDIKEENILVSNSLKKGFLFKIIDFDIAWRKSNTLKENAGRIINGFTQGYVAPELYCARSYKEISELNPMACQIYSVGVLILRSMGVIENIPKLKTIDYYKKDFEMYEIFLERVNEFKTKDDLSKNILEIVKICIDYNPIKRLGPDELLQILENVPSKSEEKIKSEYEDLLSKQIESKSSFGSISTQSSSAKSDFNNICSIDIKGKRVFFIDKNDKNFIESLIVEFKKNEIKLSQLIIEQEKAITELESKKTLIFELTSKLIENEKKINHLESVIVEKNNIQNIENNEKKSNTRKKEKEEEHTEHIEHIENNDHKNEKDLNQNQELLTREDTDKDSPLCYTKQDFDEAQKNMNHDLKIKENENILLTYYARYDILSDKNRQRIIDYSEFSYNLMIYYLVLFNHLAKGLNNQDKDYNNLNTILNLSDEESSQLRSSFQNFILRQTGNQIFETMKENPNSIKNLDEKWIRYDYLEKMDIFNDPKNLLYKDKKSGYLFYGTFENSILIKLFGSRPEMGNIIPGNFYFGTFENGMKNGEGIQEEFKLNIYEGEFKNNVYNGIGKMVFRDGSYYIGEWKEGTTKGIGKFVNSEGQISEGNFINEQLNGIGKQYWSQQTYYIGNLKDNIRNGYGKQVYDNQYFYEGFWKDGEEHGYGKWYNYEDRYEGQFSHGKFHGFGRYCNSKGRIYEGEFFEGLSTGRGIEFNPLKGFYEGDFVNDAFEGYGRIIYPQGDFYIGAFKDGKKDGYGLIIKQDGSCFEGMFCSDSAESGILFNDLAEESGLLFGKWKYNHDIYLKQYLGIYEKFGKYLHYQQSSQAIKIKFRNGNYLFDLLQKNQLSEARTEQNSKISSILIEGLSEEGKEFALKIFDFHFNFQPSFKNNNSNKNNENQMPSFPNDEIDEYTTEMKWEKRSKNGSVYEAVIDISMMQQYVRGKKQIESGKFLEGYFKLEGTKLISEHFFNDNLVDCSLNPHITLGSLDSIGSSGSLWSYDRKSKLDNFNGKSNENCNGNLNSNNDILCKAKDNNNSQIKQKSDHSTNYSNALNVSNVSNNSNGPKGSNWKSNINSNLHVQSLNSISLSNFYF